MRSRQPAKPELKMTHIAAENRGLGRGQPLAGFSHIPIFVSDLAPFGAEVGVGRRAIWAVHRDASGRETGREVIHGSPTTSGAAFSFTPGGRKSLFRSPGPCRARLVLADGPMQAVCIAAVEGASPTSPITYAAHGGVWTAAASHALVGLLRASPPTQIVLAFAAARDGACASVMASIDAIREASIAPVPIRRLGAPAGGWIEALRLGRRSSVV